MPAVFCCQSPKRNPPQSYGVGLINYSDWLVCTWLKSSDQILQLLTLPSTEKGRCREGQVGIVICCLGSKEFLLISPFNLWLFCIKTFVLLIIFVFKLKCYFESLTFYYACRYIQNDSSRIIMWEDSQINIDSI